MPQFPHPQAQDNPPDAQIPPHTPHSSRAEGDATRMGHPRAVTPLGTLTGAPAGPGEPGVPDSPRGPWAPSGPRAPVGPASPWGERNGVRWGTVPQFPLPQSYLHLSAQPLPSNRGLRGSRELRQGRRVPGGTGKCGGAAQAGGAPEEPLWGSAEYWGAGSKRPHTYRGSSRAGEAVIASSTLGGDGSYGGGVTAPQSPPHSPVP